MECLKMSTVDGGHYQPRISLVRAATADGYAQAPVRIHQDPLSGPCEKPRATVHAVRSWQPVPRPTKADCMRRTLPKIRGWALQGCFLQHSDRKIGPHPHSKARLLQNRRSRCGRSDVPYVS